MSKKDETPVTPFAIGRLAFPLTLLLLMLGLWAGWQARSDTFSLGDTWRLRLGQAVATAPLLAIGLAIVRGLDVFLWHGAIPLTMPHISAGHRPGNLSKWRHADMWPELFDGIARSDSASDCGGT